MRFIQKIDNRDKLRCLLVRYPKKYFTAQEIADAKVLWDLAVQKHWYEDVHLAIKNGTKLSLRDQLGLQIDETGLLRCHGRFQNAELSEMTRRPKLLPTKDHYTKLVIQNYHKMALHSGISQTLAAVHQEYWVPQGRSRIRLVLLDCHLCRRAMGGPYKLPAMAPWPKERMSQSAPFSYTGIDYFGPLYVRDNPGDCSKVWICLFTCISVHAIHLELIDDMSSNKFIMCLRRFISCHGKPVQIISDNATQFKLAKSTLDKAWSTVVLDPDTQNYVTNQGIQWKFIIEFSPWMGGFYERMVGLVKSSMRKAIGKVCLTTCELNTLLSEVQAVVNSRPLVHVGDDLNSDNALTPAHFMSLNPRVGVPEFVYDNNDPDYANLNTLSSAENLLLTWKKGQQHLNHFWKIWKDSYLLSLRERTQHHVAQGRIQSRNIPQKDDVVLIKENLPRGSWKLGKIQSLISSQDGQQQAAVILLPNRKTINRSVSLLYPIECSPVSALPVSVDDSAETNDQVTDDTLPTDTAGTDVHTVSLHPRRAAAVRARDNIQRCIKDMVGLQLETA